MEQITCPHCGKGIELVGAKDLEDQFGMGANAVAHARAKLDFPAPVLDFANRKLYLRSEVEAYRERRSQTRLRPLTVELLKEIDSLPPAMQAKVRKELRDQLGVSKRRT